MENALTDKTNGTVEQVDTKYELLKRGDYVVAVNPTQVTPIALDPNQPTELSEARNAVRIAG